MDGLPLIEFKECEWRERQRGGERMGGCNYPNELLIVKPPGIEFANPENIRIFILNVSVHKFDLLLAEYLPPCISSRMPSI